MKIAVNKHILRNVCILIAVTVFGILLYFVISNYISENVIAASVSEQYYDLESKYVMYKGENYEPKDNIETFLLIGVDKYESDAGELSYNNSQQSDFLLLVIINKDDKTYAALQLNRDTMANITELGVRGENAGTIKAQLALAHTYGSGGKDSCRNTVEAVSDLLYGVSIDHYIAFTMDAVPIVNDLAGGVTLEILDDFTAEDPDMKKGVVHTILGEESLIYVRGRYGLEDNTNIGRMARQRQYLTEIKKMLLTQLNESNDFAAEVLSKISEYMVSDCTVGQLSELVDSLNSYAEDGIDVIDGKSVIGEKYNEFYVDEDALRSYVISRFYKPCEK